MNRTPHVAWILTIACMLPIVFSVSCTKNPYQPSPIPFGEPFQLRAGTSARLPGGLTISFDRIKSDSRCPLDVVCVWAGDAVITVSLWQSRGGRVERDLHTDPSGSEASYLAYTIKLVRLMPYPRLDRPMRPEDYVATLTVTAP